MIVSLEDSLVSHSARVRASTLHFEKKKKKGTRSRLLLKCTGELNATKVDVRLLRTQSEPSHQGKNRRADSSRANDGLSSATQINVVVALEVKLSKTKKKIKILMGFTLGGDTFWRTMI